MTPKEQVIKEIKKLETYYRDTVRLSVLEGREIANDMDNLIQTVNEITECYPTSEEDFINR